MNINKFLERIHYYDSIEQSVSCLAKLEKQFLKYIPFENLNIINKNIANYTLKSLYSKIVIEKRGGLCYETNSLFAWALAELGFNVRIIAAEMFPEANLKQQFYHMALIVVLNNNRYLVDVGNGKYFGGPINIYSSNTFIGEGISYKIANYNDDFLGLYEYKLNHWRCRYAFNLVAKSFTDFKQARQFTELASESAFNKKILISIFTENYRLTLTGNNLVKTCYKTRSKQKTIIANSELDKNIRFLLEK